MTRREIPLDAREILRALSEHSVDYVVIGGLAVQAHGHPRTTQDLDIIPEPSVENLRRLTAALSALNARPVGKGRPERGQVPTTGVLELDTEGGGLDVHLDPPGAASYKDLRARALRLELEDPDIGGGPRRPLAIKRISGRPIDRSDIIALTDPGTEPTSSRN
jgi:hypothetical protein